MGEGRGGEPAQARRSAGVVYSFDLGKPLIKPLSIINPTPALMAIKLKVPHQNHGSPSILLDTASPNKHSPTGKSSTPT